MSGPVDDRVRSGEWATILLAAALLVTLGSGLIDQSRGIAALKTVEQEQAAALEVSKRVEAQLNALASGTQQLADGGNANAQAVLATLQQNGIRVNAAAQK